MSPEELKIMNKIAIVNLFPPGRDSAPDWVEDFSYENGNYMCTCVMCKCAFVGHKRRVVCKLCDSVKEKKSGMSYSPFS